MSGRNRALLTIVVTVVVLGALYPLVRALHDSRDNESFPASFRLDIPAAETGPESRKSRSGTFEDFPVFKGRQGERLTLTIRSEQKGSIHVHGYEMQVELVPSRDVTLSFEAKDAGLFPVHLHGADNVMEHMATFEIQPK